MQTITAVCLITITVTLVLLISAMFFLLKEVRRLNSIADRLMMQWEREINAVVQNISRFSSDLSNVSATVRSQVERVDLTAERISRDVISLVETCTRTAYLVHDAVAEPLIDMAALIKGCSQGLRFFFSSRNR